MGPKYNKFTINQNIFDSFCYLFLLWKYFPAGIFKELLVVLLQYWIKVLFSLFIEIEDNFWRGKKSKYILNPRNSLAESLFLENFNQNKKNLLLDSWEW